METMVTARHCSISDTLRLRTLERLEALARVEPKVQSAYVCFVADHGTHRAEVRVHGTRGRTMVATGSGGSFRSALDAAVERMERQLKRRRERLTARKSARPSPVL